MRWAWLLVFFPVAGFAAFPQITDTETTLSSTAMHTINRSTCGAGDLELVASATAGVTVSIAPSGYTELSAIAGSGGVYLDVWYRTLSTASTPADSLVIEYATSSMGVSYVVCVDDGDVPQAGTATGNGTASDPDPPSLTASWGSADNLWIAFSAMDEDSSATVVSSYPANYTATAWEDTDSATGSVRALSMAVRENATATENPGAYNIATDETWESNTIVVQLVTAGATGGMFWKRNAGR